MCILRKCANPTEVGVWWREDTKWCLYSASHQALIRQGIANQLQQIDLGTIVSKVHPRGAPYVVNLQRMEQVAVRTGQRRPVTVIDPPSPQTVQLEVPPQRTVRRSRKSSCKNLSLNLHYRDTQGNLQRYGQDIVRAVTQALAASVNRKSLLVQDSHVNYFFFDLEAMEQYFVSHLVEGKPVLLNMPPVQVIDEVPWDAAAMASLAAKADKCLRRKILVTVIDSIRSDEHLDRILPLKACPWKIVSKSTSTCSAPLYEKFVDSVEEILQTFPGDLMGYMIEMAGSKEVGNGPVQIAFKPVELLIGSSSKHICGDGMVTSNKAAFWMSMAAPAAAATANAVVYGCTLQLIAYLVLIPIRTSKDVSRKRKISEECSDYVEVDRLEHQLPLAEVTVW